MPSGHSPLPWKVWESKTGASFKEVFRHKRTVCFHSPEVESNVAIAFCDYHTPEVAEANAAFIVTACNSHQKMVEALRAILPFLDDLDDATDGVGAYPDVTCTQRCRDAVAKARAALALAEPSER